jgi:hypothetical protein
MNNNFYMYKFSMLKTMFNEYSDALIQFIDKMSTNRRTYKYSTSYCLEHVCFVLQTNLSWKYLSVDCHYSTIFKRFQYWTKLGIFELFYEHITQQYITKQLEANPLHFKTLYIDASMIKNRRGIDFLGPNHYDRFRLATKMSMICDINKIPLSTVFTPANIGDSEVIEPCLVKLRSERLRINNRFNHALVADLGYMKCKGFKDDMYNRYQVRLVHPYKCNQKFTEQEKLNIKAAKEKERLQLKADKIQIRSDKIISDKLKTRKERLGDLEKARNDKAKQKAIKLKEKQRLQKEKIKARKLKRKNKANKVYNVDNEDEVRNLNTVKERAFLKERYKIENAFCRLDKFKKIRDREESTLHAYMSLNFLAMTVVILKFL